MSLEVWYPCYYAAFCVLCGTILLGVPVCVAICVVCAWYVCVAMCVTRVPHFNNKMHFVYRVTLQDGEDPWDALSLFVLSEKEPYN